MMLLLCIYITKDFLFLMFLLVFYFSCESYEELFIAFCESDHKYFSGDFTCILRFFFLKFFVAQLTDFLLSNVVKNEKFALLRDKSCRIKDFLVLLKKNQT